jgi:biuret amidohydrolase
MDARALWRCKHRALTTSLLAIHYQNDVLHPQGRIRAGLAEDDPARPGLVANAATLLTAARGSGIPVISLAMVFPVGHIGVVQNSEMFRAAARRHALVDGTWGAEFQEQLRPRPDEHVVKHSRINGFYESRLAGVLRGLGTRRLVVAGVATHSSVEHTARHAADIGYDVVIAADACAAADPELHAAALRTLETHVDRISTVGEIVATFGTVRG